jgi:CheY-like chemotaxis protein
MHSTDHRISRTGAANAMQGGRDAGLAAGMDDCMTKSIRLEALVEALNQAKTRDEN